MTNSAPARTSRLGSRSSSPETADHNLAVVLGRLSSDPAERVLPSGTRLTNYEVTVSSADGPAETVPVVLFDVLGPKVAAGDGVLVVGRVRRRFFRSGGVTVSRTEVVADHVVPRRRRSAVHRDLARIAGELGGLG